MEMDFISRKKLSYTSASLINLSLRGKIEIPMHHSKSQILTSNINTSSTASFQTHRY